MRGEVLHYDDGAGSGLISGDDGVRYDFRRADLQQLRPISRGMRVDFVAVGNAASQIFLLENQPLETTNEDLSLWGYFAKCMAKSFNGEGRARRKEYWSFVLFELIFFALAFVIMAIAAGAMSATYDYGYDSAGMHLPGLIPLLIVLVLIIFIPAGITVTIRRLHDIGLTGWFIFIALIPYLGSIILLIMSLIPSEARANKHGPYPKPSTYAFDTQTIVNKTQERRDKARSSLGIGIVLSALAGGFVAAAYVVDAYDPSGYAQSGMMVPAVLLGALGIAFVLLAIVDYVSVKKARDA